MAVRRQQCAEGVRAVRHVAGTLWAKNFRPAIFRQMPRAERAPLRFAAAAHMRGDLLVLECRSRSEVVALFLAVLELSKAHKLAIVEQEEGYLLTLVGE